MPESPGSISVWISQLKSGGDEAQEAIWRRFHRQLQRLARGMLPQSVRVEADEEDVVNVAFHSFFRRLERDGFAKVEDRSDLWRLLSAITRRKAVNQIRRFRAAKRSSEHVAGAEPEVLESQHDGQPTPETVAIQEEAVRVLLQLLDEDLQRIALLKLNGRTNDEIAAQIRRSIPTVERRLRLIRRKWETAMEGATLG